MENKMRRNILIAASVLTAAAVIILTVIGLAAENRDYEPASWVLKIVTETRAAKSIL